MKRGRIATGVVCLAGLALWIVTAPPDHMVVAPSVEMGTPEAVVEVTAPAGALGVLIERVPSALPAVDDFVVLEDGHTALATAIDGWLWRIDFDTGAAGRVADAPLMAAGLHEVSGAPGQVYLCSSHFMGAVYPQGEAVGLYRFDLESGSFSAIVKNVPANTPPLSGLEADGLVFADGADAPEIDQADGGANSRPLAFCNDLEVSEDGRRIYFTEPFSYPGASMGGGAIGEAITLAGNGRLWRHDLDTGRTRLIAQGFNFIDGILTEASPAGGREESVLVSQTSSFGITRFFLSGARAGQFEYVWRALPGMPDGLDRDSEGRIWSGIIKCRSGSITWIHANAWIKPLLLRLPHSMVPVSTCTGVMVLSADAATPLYFGALIDPKVTAIASAIEYDGQVYLANVDTWHHDLLRIDVADILQD